MAAAETSRNTVARGAGANASSFVLRFAARAAMLYIGAKLYGPAAYGAFIMAVAVVELAVPVASLGLKRMIFPWLEEQAAARGAPHILLDALLLAVVVGVVLAAMIVAVAALLPDALLSHRLRLALLIVTPALVGQVVSDIALAATRWTQRMRYEVVARGFVEPYIATGVSFLCWLRGMTDTGMVLGYWAATAALTLFSLGAARQGLGAFAPRSWRPDLSSLAARARQLVAATGGDVVFNLSQRIDLFLVGLLLGDAPAGVYGAVREFRTPILQVRQSFDGILVPLGARVMQSGDDAAAGAAMAAATRVILAIQLGIVLLLAAAGHWLLGLFGAQYAGGYATFLLLLLAETVNGAFGVSELILYFRRPGLVWINNLVMIGVAVVAIVLLAPWLGSAGAALGMGLAGIASALLRRRWLAHIGVTRPLFHAAVPLGAALVGAAAALVLTRMVPAMASDWLAILPALLALGLYGAAIRGWMRISPGALSMDQFQR